MSVEHKAGGLGARFILQSTQNTPDEFEIKIENSNGELLHNVRIMKLEHYTVDDIFKKRIYILQKHWLNTMPEGQKLVYCTFSSSLLY